MFCGNHFIIVRVIHCVAQVREIKCALLMMSETMLYRAPPLFLFLCHSQLVHVVTILHIHKCGHIPEVYSLSLSSGRNQKRHLSQENDDYIL